jgi:glycosyl hydrolase family 12
VPQVTLDRTPGQPSPGERSAGERRGGGRYRGGHRTGPQRALRGGAVTAGRGTARSRRARSAAVLGLTGILAGGGLAAIGVLASGGGGFTTTGAVALQPAAVASLPGAGSAQGAGSAIPSTMPQFNFPPSPLVTVIRAKTPSALGNKPTPAATPSASATPSATASAPPSTHPASTPSASATPPPVSKASCGNPVFSTSTKYGTYTSLPYFVAADMWNVGSSSASQTLNVCAPGSWSVTATVSGGGNSVKTYPNVHRDFSSPAVSSLNSVTSSFAESGPGDGTYENAYDIWLNGIANPGGGSDEVMIWNENHGQIPGGSPQGTVTFGGRTYTVWKGDGNYFAFVANSTFTSGTLNLLDFFKYLMSKGWVPGNSTLSEVCYGVEIVATNGAETFNVTNFSVDAS